MTIPMKATKQYSPVVMFIIIIVVQMALTFESMGGILRKA